MNKSSEGAAKTPHGIDTGRRRLLIKTATIAGTVLATDALSKTETAYAVVKTALNFRERRKPVNLASSLSLDTQVTKQSKSQGQPGNLQDTPTPDATVAAAQKDLVIQQDQKAQKDNSIWGYLTYLGLPASVLLTGTLGFVTYWYNRRKDRVARRTEQEKQDEARFQTVVSGLGSSDMATRTAAANLMGLFLNPEQKESYQRFYNQIFRLAVTHLRLRVVDPNNPEPNQFYQEIIKLFSKSRKRIVETQGEEEKIKSISSEDQKREEIEQFQETFLDASEVHLEGAYLRYQDLQYIFMEGAYLTRANLSHAILTYATLNGADLSYAILYGAKLYHTDLHTINTSGKNFGKRTNLSHANLSRADLGGADLREATLDGANPEDARSLEGTYMWGVNEYLSEEQIKKCKDKHANFNAPFIKARRY